jgi:hypothetical protein
MDRFLVCLAIFETFNLQIHVSNQNKLFSFFVELIFSKPIVDQDHKMFGLFFVICSCRKPQVEFNLTKVLKSDTCSDSTFKSNINKCLSYRDDEWYYYDLCKTDTWDCDMYGFRTYYDLNLTGNCRWSGATCKFNTLVLPSGKTWTNCSGTCHSQDLSGGAIAGIVVGVVVVVVVVFVIVCVVCCRSRVTEQTATLRLSLESGPTYGRVPEKHRAECAVMA